MPHHLRIGYGHASIAVTTRVRGIAVEVALGKSDELPRKCAVNADTITTIPKRSLAKRIGMLSPEKRAQLDDAVRFALGLDA